MGLGTIISSKGEFLFHTSNSAFRLTFSPSQLSFKPAVTRWQLKYAQRTAKAALLIFHAASIGYAAYETLLHDQAAAVIGVTSRGIFVRAAGNRVIFVSFEEQRGPLTITFDQPILLLKESVIGETVEVTSGRLLLPSIKVTITISLDAVWRYPNASTPIRSKDKQLKDLKQIARGVLASKDDEGFGALLPPLFNLPVDQQRPPLLNHILSLRHALAETDIAQMVELINGLLGLGRGLTPSGDDCAIGLLLMLNRWRTDRNWEELNQQVIKAAYQRTTTISANLIECAADGQADERLMKVVDGIVTGTPSVDECVDHVLDWGSSSGVDALVGMAIAVTA